MAGDLESMLVELHGEVISTLLERLKSGAASPQEIAQAISILKHDNIQLSRDDDPAMQALEERAKNRLDKMRKEGEDVTSIDRVYSYKGLGLA